MTDTVEKEEGTGQEEQPIGRNYGYIRVSTTDQNSERQLAGIELDNVFEDKCSGSTTDRPELKTVLRILHSGDTLHVHDISRLARSLGDLKSIIDNLMSRKVTVKFHKEGLTFSTFIKNPIQDLQLSMLGAVYEFERSMMLERQREGIAKAKEAGKYRGGVKKIDRQAVIDTLNEGRSVRKTAEKLGIAASSVARIKKEWKDSQKGT